MEDKVTYQTELSKEQGTGNLPIPVVGGSALLSQVFNEDCVTGMKRWPDKYFDLAVVDPPYGIGMDGGKIGVDGDAKAKQYTKKEWDAKCPDKTYFAELWRVSKNQIVWGANHFISMIPFDSSAWIVWDKDKVGGYFADCELAYTSFDTAVRKFKYTWHGFIQQNMKHKEERIHPTQKPIALYEWIFANYASEGNLILDTHLGSGSSRIAAYKAGLQFVGYEIDKEYYEAQERRFKIFVSQGRLF